MCKIDSLDSIDWVSILCVAIYNSSCVGGLKEAVAVFSPAV
jgi:hypothetical protein